MKKKKNFLEACLDIFRQDILRTSAAPPAAIGPFTLLSFIFCRGSVTPLSKWRCCNEVNFLLINKKSKFLQSYCIEQHFRTWNPKSQIRWGSFVYHTVLSLPKYCHNAVMFSAGMQQLRVNLQVNIFLLLHVHFTAEIGICMLPAFIFKSQK